MDNENNILQTFWKKSHIHRDKCRVNDNAQDFATVNLLFSINALESIKLVLFMHTDKYFV